MSDMEERERSVRRLMADQMEEFDLSDLERVANGPEDAVHLGMMSVPQVMVKQLFAERAQLKAQVKRLEHRVSSVQYWLNRWDDPEPATTAQLVLGLRAALGDEP